MTVAGMTLWLIMVLGIWSGGYLSFAEERGVSAIDRVDDAKDGHSAHILSGTPVDAETRANLCADCAIPNVEIFERTFTEGTDCLCIGTESITIGEGVIIESGARVTFEAPKVYIKHSFKAEKGSTVIIQWDTPPPPPG